MNANQLKFLRLKTIEKENKEKELNRKLGYAEDHDKGSLGIGIRWDNLRELIESHDRLQLLECAINLHYYAHEDDINIPINDLIEVLQQEKPPYLTKEECEEYIRSANGSLSDRFPILEHFIDMIYSK